jgi:hypothetical protein
MERQLRMDNPLRWGLVGILSTLTMDLGTAALRAAGITSGIPPRLIGRWFASLARGQLHHDTILQAPPVPGEVPIALVCHYLIGITLAVVFGSLLSLLRVHASPVIGLVLALGFGILTNLLPWLLMFPSMGFGTFGGAAPAELMLLRSSFLGHVLFGAGLAASACALGFFTTATAY